VSTVFPVRQAVHPTNQHRLSSAGEGRSKDNYKSPQAENDKNWEKIAKTKIIVYFQVIDDVMPPQNSVFAWASQCKNTHCMTCPHGYPQPSTRVTRNRRAGTPY
ncbi:hypothetical protein, partial [Ruegeria arenilitoris]|uniref:hypothetical protein n=1 Tax=Ruegeria arenilitoris TaxID=1173585 RepID=UPI001C2BDAC2